MAIDWAAPCESGDAALGVYVHWPYCARICPYCDFNVYRNREVDAQVWTRALVSDLEYWAGRVRRRPVASVYFGGGTPSLAPLETLAGIIDACARLFGFEEGAEITLEANPADVTSERLAAWRGAGVNRMSLGVQSFDDRTLRILGRDHDGADARRAVDRTIAAFPNASFDLIYAAPEQSINDWEQALCEALDFAPAHLSLYQLTIEPGTAFARAAARGAIAPMSDDASADFFDLAQAMTAKAGLPAYEISNHARPGAQSRHNRLYWTYQDYIGVGPGAHGRVAVDGERIATETYMRAQVYLAACEREGNGVAAATALDAEAALIERLTLGLRLVEGVVLPANDLRQLGARRDRLAALADDGMLRVEGARIAATSNGRRVLNALLRDMLT